MPEPDIIRRCAICGASFRSGAAFCPQCGNAVSAKSPTNPAAESPPKPSDGIALAETAPDLTAAQIEQQTLASYNVQPQALPAKESATTPVASAPHLSETAPVIREPAPATAPARDVSQVRAPNVEKRGVSSTVLREARYDPSVRFVLVAVSLFVMTLLLLLVSKYMR
jgi:cell pole-organizing protein PopZ